MSITFNESREIAEETFTVDDIIIKFINTTISVVDDEPVVIYIEPPPESIMEKLKKEKEKERRKEREANGENEVKEEEPLQIVYEVKNCSIKSSFTLRSSITGVNVEESYIIIRESNPFRYFSIDDIHIESKYDNVIVLDSSTIYICKINFPDYPTSLKIQGREGIELKNSSLYLYGSDIKIDSSHKPILLKNTTCMLRANTINLIGKIGIDANNSSIYVDYDIIGTIDIKAGFDCIKSYNGTIIINLNANLNLKTENDGISLDSSESKLLMNIEKNLRIKSKNQPTIYTRGLLIIDIHEYTSLNLLGGINNQHEGILKIINGEFSFRNSDNNSSISFNTHSNKQSTISKSSFKETIIRANKYSLDYNTGDVKYTDHKGELHDKKIEIEKKASLLQILQKAKENQKKNN